MYDILIIGGGVIGNLLAYELSRYQLEVVLLEKENDLNLGATRANTAIVHSGYDPEPGSLMAKLNVEGCALFPGLCRDFNVEYKNNGSLVLALREEDLVHLDKLYHNALANGVPGVEILTGDQVLAKEPAVNPKVLAGLWTPTAGICLPWQFSLAAAELAAINGVAYHLNTEVVGISRSGMGYEVKTTGGHFRSRFVVNCAGIYSDKIHEMIAPKAFTIYPTRGEYKLLDKMDPEKVKSTIFQCPTERGKGVLVAPTVHGNLLIGPDASRQEDKEDNSCSRRGLDYIAGQALQSVPGLDYRSTIREFAGIRANSDYGDFYIEMADRGFLDIAAIKSPGLTAAPAIAKYGVGILEENGLELQLKESWQATRPNKPFNRLNPTEQAELVAQDPKFGQVICRCETVTEGDILAAIHSPIPPSSLDGIKRRCGSGLGRCQGGFCGPRILEILARELGKDPSTIVQDRAGSWILTGPSSKGVDHEK